MTDIEIPIGITERFLKADINTRRRIIIETDGPIIIANIYNTGECDKYFSVSAETYKNKENIERLSNYYFWHSSHAFHLSLKDKYENFTEVTEEYLCRKNIIFSGLFDNKKIFIAYNLIRFAEPYYNKTIQIINMINFYETKKWITSGYIYSLAMVIFSYDYDNYPRENIFYTTILELCDKYNVPINNLLKDIYCNKNAKPLENGIQILLERYIKDKNIIGDYAAIQIKNSECSSNFIKFCIDNNLNIITDMSSLCKMIGILNNHELIIKIIEIYKMANCYIPNNYLVYTLLDVYDEYVFQEPELMKIINENILDYVLFYASSNTILKCISHGFKFTNRIYKLYIECGDCHNGEPHPCNWRNINANFVSLQRFNISLVDISDINCKENYDIFSVSYSEFDGLANNLEIYTNPGIDELELSEEDNEDYEYDSYKQHNYRIPPKTYLINDETSIEIINIPNVQLSV